MCQITCNLYRECSHHNRILALCPAKQTKRLQQYNQYRRRQERQLAQGSEKSYKSSKPSFWSCFCSSSAEESDPIPRPLIRPATEFLYTTLEPPKIAVEYSCRKSKITHKTSTHWSACPDCTRAKKAQARAQAKARLPSRSQTRSQVYSQARPHPPLPLQPRLPGNRPIQRSQNRPQARPQQLPPLRTQYPRH